MKGVANLYIYISYRLFMTLYLLPRDISYDVVNVALCLVQGSGYYDYTLSVWLDKFHCSLNVYQISRYLTIKLAYTRNTAEYSHTCLWWVRNNLNIQHTLQAPVHGGESDSLALGIISKVISLKYLQKRRGRMLCGALKLKTSSQKVALAIGKVFPLGGHH